MLTMTKQQEPEIYCSYFLSSPVLHKETHIIFRTIKDVINAIKENQDMLNRTKFNVIHFEKTLYRNQKTNYGMKLWERTEDKVVLEHIAFVLSDTIFYPKDLKYYLQTIKYPIPETPKLDENIPATINGLYTKTKQQVYTYVDDAHKDIINVTVPYEEKSVNWTNLNPHKHKIVDFNLNEIWPNKTNNIPTELCNMLNIKQK